MKQHFIFRGHNEKQLQTAIRDVKEMTRAELLRAKDKDVLQKKDPQSVFVCTWHPKLKRLPSILNENHKILNSDTKLNIVFPSTCSVFINKISLLQIRN